MICIRRHGLVSDVARLPEAVVAVHLGQAEIENLGVSALGDKDVSGLDVAVDDAFGVSGVERVRNLDGERQ